MPGADQGPLGPDMEERLRRELDAVQPMFSSPRYLSTNRRPAALRFAPVALAAAVLGILALTAYAGSPNPRVWTEHVFAVVHPAKASPTPNEVSPRPQPSPTEDRHETPEPTETAEPRESPGPHESPEPNQSPEPSGGGETGSGGSGSNGSDSGSGGSGSGESSPEPTPTSGDH